MSLILLDRDGVINVESHEYIKNPDEWLPIPNSLEAIATLCQKGYIVAVATNQSGLARGLFDLATLNAIHEKMQQAVQAAGGVISAIFYCPHMPDDNCVCRKPQPGLIHQALKHFNMAADQVPFIGDSYRDIQAARAAKCQPILVKTGNGMQTMQDNNDLSDVKIYNDIAEFAKEW